MYLVVFWYFRNKNLVYTRYLKIWYIPKIPRPIPSPVLNLNPLPHSTRSRTQPQPAQIATQPAKWVGSLTSDNMTIYHPSSHHFLSSSWDHSCGDAWSSIILISSVAGECRLRVLFSELLAVMKQPFRFKRPA